ncbi:MAG: hypothetical protein DRO12_05625 [Thermoprotei archaeon]|nr:MAG: hypothetical protein DRO12_05625 [Thermoprotei archaeon]
MLKLALEWFVEGVSRCRDQGFDSLVVVDALRFSATVALALSLGIERVIPVRSVEEARKYSGKPGYLVAIEVGGAKQPGADIGNSPTELIELFRRGKLKECKILVIRTSSGAQAVAKARELGFGSVFVASFVNAKFLAQVVARQGIESLCIVCAGRDSKHFAIEDLLAAGAITDEITSSVRNVEMCEKAWGAYLAWKGVVNLGIDLPSFVKSVGDSGKKLVELGYERDISFALNLNTVPAVPMLVGNHLVDIYRRL